MGKGREGKEKRGQCRGYIGRMGWRKVTKKRYAGGATEKVRREGDWMLRGWRREGKGKGEGGKKG